MLLFNQASSRRGHLNFFLAKNQPHPNLRTLTLTLPLVSGHYMGWVRQEGDDWLVFDDEDVSPCKTEDIMNLKGGGDWHMAYLTFYRFKE